MNAQARLQRPPRSTGLNWFMRTPRTMEMRGEANAAREKSRPFASQRPMPWNWHAAPVQTHPRAATQRDSHWNPQ